MRVVDTFQNSKEWKAWRGGGIGASNAAVVLGISPFQSPFELWLELTGLCERAPVNEFALAAMRRGTELEPVARALFEKQIGKTYAPLSAEHDEFAFIRASLDGYHAESNSLIEIKCPGKVAHAEALKGRIPKYYYPQIQQQFLVTGATSGWYVSWDGKSAETVNVAVVPDAAYISELQAKLIHFWGLVSMHIPPPSNTNDLAKLSARVEEASKRLAAASKALTILVEGL